MHICIITSARIFDIPYSGEGRFAASLGKWLASRTHIVTLMGSGFASIKTKQLSKFDMNPSLEISDVKNGKHKKVIFLYPPYPVYLLSRLVMTVLWSLKILLINRKSAIKLVHAQDTGYSGLAAVISGKLLRIPVIISSHGIRHITLESVIRGRFRKILLWFERHLDIFVVKNADRILVVNPAIGLYFQQLILSTKRIDVMPIPIKLRNFKFSKKNRDEIRNELGITTDDENTRVIGYIGRFSPEKNLTTLLDSFANMAQDYSNIKLVLVGAGQLEHELKEYTVKRAIEDKVIFYGVRYDIGRILAALDIFVLPSYTEGLSTALLEAMASGRAIVCSDIAANHQLVAHDREGLFVNPYDPIALENAMRLLANNDSLRLRLGENAKIRASEYDEEIVFSKILRYYEALVSEPQ
ncbi:MAG: glycosyltransferase [Nitrososphaeraceae archaeon]|nr:glycosyltransferase [Nitrososphaeraceae archaeon]